ncbi:MAG: hypothetical protein AMS24_00645 [Chlamydiae bacterium SM23_39]|nr:MAG: hypothetical protein AMS24_00645 [Chlamydiae bacterium SM23_39]
MIFLKPFFKCTFLDPVDLSDESIKNNFSDASLEKISKKAQNLIAQKDLQKILSSPLVSFTKKEHEEKLRKSKRESQRF